MKILTIIFGFILAVIIQRAIKVKSKSKELVRNANSGDSEAQYELALAGIKAKNNDIYLNYLEKSALQDHDKAQFLLGKLNYLEEIPNADKERGKELILKSAKQGNQNAINFYGKYFVE